MSRATAGVWIGFACAWVLIAAPAHAGWQYAQFGMKPDEVVNASSGKAQLTDRSRNIEGCAGKAMGTTRSRGSRSTSRSASPDPTTTSSAFGSISKTDQDKALS